MSKVKVKFNAEKIFNGKVRYSSDFIEVVTKYEGVLLDAFLMFGEFELELDGTTYSLSEDTLIVEKQFTVSIEGERREQCSFHDVLSILPDVTSFEVDVEALESDLKYLETNDSVKLREDCWIHRVA